MTIHVKVEIELTLQTEEQEETLTYLRDDLESTLTNWIDKEESVDRITAKVI